MKIHLEFDGVDELHHFTAHWYERLIPKRKYTREIDSLGLTARASNCLKGAQIDTIDQLCGLREIDLLQIPNLGRNALNDIIECLELHGRKLAV